MKAIQDKSKIIRFAAERQALADLRAGRSITENTASSVREILANCKHTIEEILRNFVIPKLYAKEIKVITSRGKVETLVVDNHDIQLKTAVELAKMCGCYTAAKSDGDTDSTDQTAQADLSGASDDELIAIIKLASNIKERNSVGQNRILQAKANDMAPGR